MQKKITVPRQTRDGKSKILTFRLTDAESNSLEALKTRMGFTSLRDFIVHSMNVMDRLHEWNENGEKFFKGKNVANIGEVDLGLSPRKQNIPVVKRGRKKPSGKVGAL
jgi:hypothetical protein